MQFLDALGGRWNISLFHYRNHGADFGRVLAAFEVPDGERGAFDAFLSGLGYHYTVEEGNEAVPAVLGHLAHRSALTLATGGHVLGAYFLAGTLQRAGLSAGPLSR